MANLTKGGLIKAYFSNGKTGYGSKDVNTSLAVNWLLKKIKDLGKKPLTNTEKYKKMITSILKQYRKLQKNKGTALVTWCAMPLELPTVDYRRQSTTSTSKVAMTRTNVLKTQDKIADTVRDTVRKVVASETCSLKMRLEERSKSLKRALSREKYGCDKIIRLTNSIEEHQCHGHQQQGRQPKKSYTSRSVS